MLLDSLADIWEIYIFLIVVTDLLENQSCMLKISSVAKWKKLVAITYFQRYDT